MSDQKYSLDHIASVGSPVYTHGSYLFLPQLLQALLSSSDKILYEVALSGILTIDIESFVETIEAEGGRLVTSSHNGQLVFIWQDLSFLIINFNRQTKDIGISGFTSNPECNELISRLKNKYISDKKTNLVFSILKKSDSLSITNLGDGSSPLIEENYSPQVIEDVNFVVSSFQKNPPHGRICILNGEPGTGKTHLIRSILQKMDCVFLIVPTNLIDSLDKPDFLPLLLSIKEDYKRPIVLIIEDGDICLVPRKNDNISTIASMLNLSDGILGSIVDIKMIISTNALIKDMDPAIMRPGRLCRQIYVNALPYDQANKVYQRLMKDDAVRLDKQSNYTLAEIYSIVNNQDSSTGGSMGPSNRRVIGFSRPTDSQDLTINKVER
jgi:hypothetical protein